MMRVITNSGSMYEIKKNWLGIFAKRISEKYLSETPSGSKLVLGSKEKEYRLKSMPVPEIGKRLKLELDPKYHDLYNEGKAIWTTEVVGIS